MSNLVLNTGASAHEPGFFGKIPARGDFVSRRLGPGLVQPLDEWLQASIATSRRQMGEAWLPSYLETPIWRFVLGPGVCGEAPLAGVLMPSVDRVGRYFPLVLATPLPGCVAPTRLIDSAAAWFEKAENLALSCLDDGFVFDRFDQALCGLGAPPYDTTRGSSSQQSGLRVGLGEQEGRRAETYGRLLDQVLIGFNNRFSLWWTSGSDRVASSLLIAPGLPAPQNFAAFMDGHWEEWGWERPADSVLRLDDSELPILLLRPVAQMPCHGRTHAGTKRGSNQDALLLREDIGLWCVADGLGGHSDGDVASATVVNVLDQVLPPLSYAGFVDDVRDALRDANIMLRDRARTLDDHAVVASTAAILLVYANRYSCLWAGDSRVYLLRDGALRQLTSDHVAAALGNGQRTSMLVTRAVGAADTLEVDMAHDVLKPGDRFLLCSDGITKVLRDAEIAQIVAGLAPREAVDALVENILVSGAPDNLTAIIVDIPADALPATAEQPVETAGEVGA